MNEPNHSDGRDQARHEAQSVPSVKLDGYYELRSLATTYHDIQELRKAVNNRKNRAPVESMPMDITAAALETIEHDTGLQLRRLYRTVVPPAVRAWQQESKGMGEHLLARLIGHLGHPRIAVPHYWEVPRGRDPVQGEPYERSLSQLWQYSGHGRPGRVSKGMSADDLAGLGKPEVKMLLHLLAEGAIKEPGSNSLAWEPKISTEPRDRPAPTQSSSKPAKDETKPTHGPPAWKFRKVYEERRVATVGRLHNAVCVRCGPSGKPAQVGSPWSKGHAHADALRIVGKEILRDLWLASAE